MIQDMNFSYSSAAVAAATIAGGVLPTAELQSRVRSSCEISRVKELHLKFQSEIIS